MSDRRTRNCRMSALAALLRTLALAQAENDEHEEAIRACEKALKLIEKQEQPDAQLKDDLERVRRIKQALKNQPDLEELP